MRIITRQLIRSATSVGANYRSASRGKSRADFIMKLNIAEEEADETCYWLELLIDIEAISPILITELLQEAREVTAILTRSGQTAKYNLAAKKSD